jgi:hypothetical protein
VRPARLEQAHPPVQRPGSSTPSPPPSPAGRSRPTAPSATPRPRSPWAAWIRARCRPRPWRPATCPACTLSAR